MFFCYDFVLLLLCYAMFLGVCAINPLIRVKKHFLKPDFCCFFLFTKFWVSRHFQLAIDTVVHVESDFANENNQILQGNKTI